MIEFLSAFWSNLVEYSIDIVPSLVIGLVLSGIVHEILPQHLVEKYLGQRGLKPLLIVIPVGILLPVCCLGSLPVACAFRKKGVPLGPILAFLVAAPATSITAILVTWKLLGWQFTLVLCAGVVIMGLAIGLIGDLFEYKEIVPQGDSCPMCEDCVSPEHFHHSRDFFKKALSVLYYAFIDMPREIGLEILVGIVLAALVSSFAPIQNFIGQYLSGFAGYGFALIFGLVMYICSTASVPLVCAFISGGLSAGAGMVMLLAGPITSYGSLLVIKKEFGIKILVVYIAVISIMSLLIGCGASLIIQNIPCLPETAVQTESLIQFVSAAPAQLFQLFGV